MLSEVRQNRSALVEQVLHLIHGILQHDNDSRPLALMICGIAGSGKTTLSKAIVERMPAFRRISIDEIISSLHGLYGIDYPADRQLYATYQGEADAVFSQTLKDSLKQKCSTVVERSFWSKNTRDEIKQVIENEGGRWLLLYLKMKDKEEVWKRICDRSAREKDANNAFDVTKEVFEMYWNGFEAPEGEGEISLET